MPLTNRWFTADPSLEESAAPPRPLRVMFINTSLPVGGAETLLVNLVRRLDRRLIEPEVVCLKQPGPLGETLAQELPVYANLLSHKYDVRVLPRLVRLFRERRADAIVTVGAGDRMFWGRLAAAWAGVPVIASALHSTGWPDVVGRLNRMLTPITDAFIAVASQHGRYLRHAEGFPDSKIHVIPNGVDVERFRPREADPALREEFRLPRHKPVVGIVAALRPEKDHALFLRTAARVRSRASHAHFLIVGDGPLRPELMQLARDLQIDDCVRFAGTRSDIPELLALMDVAVLTSKMEASPVTILEAMAAGKPFVAPRVGSIVESIRDGITGFVVPPGDEAMLALKIVEVIRSSELAEQMGRAARQHVLKHGSLERMVQGYEDLLWQLYQTRRPGARRPEVEKEATATEGAKAEVTKAEVTKAEVTKAEVTKAEEVKAEATKSEPASQRSESTFLTPSLEAGYPTSPATAPSRPQQETPAAAKRAKRKKSQGVARHAAANEAAAVAFPNESWADNSTWSPASGAALTEPVAEQSESDSHAYPTTGDASPVAGGAAPIAMPPIDVLELLSQAVTTEIAIAQPFPIVPTSNSPAEQR